MAAPSKSFTVIPDADVDPDSAITTGLMVSMRDNDIHLEEWLGLSFTAAQDHDHDGVNSKRADGANFSFVDEGSIVSDGTTFTISGLDLTTDETYWARWFLRVAGTTTGDFQCRINGDVSLAISLGAHGINQNGEQNIGTFFLTKLHDSVNNQTKFFAGGHSAQPGGGTAFVASSFEVAGDINITSLEFTAQAAGEMKGGSNAQLFRIKK